MNSYCISYQKFTRGKDVNKYSSKDIANIFGQKDSVVEKDSKESQSNDQESLDPIGTPDNSGGVITINGGNIADYFMRKGQDFPFMTKSKIQQESNSESEPEYAGFGFSSGNNKNGSESKDKNKGQENICNYAFENPCLKLNSPENISSTNNRSKSSKKRKVSDDNGSGVNNNSKRFKEDIGDKNGCKNGFVNIALNLECRADDVCNRKEFEVSRVEFGVANSALDLSEEMIDKKRVTFNDHVEYSTDCVKKKGRAKLDKFEVENKKKSKKRRKQEGNDVTNSVASGFINEALDIGEVSEEVNDNEINEKKSRKSKKRKGSRRSNLETIVETPEEDKEICEDEIKINKVKIEEIEPDNFISEGNLIKKSKKKKKKKEKAEEEMVTTDGNDTDDVAKRELNTKSEDVEFTFQKEKEDKYLAKEKKKKKNKNKSEFNEPNHDEINSKNTEEINVDDIKIEVGNLEETEAISKQSKKKKKLKNEEGTIVPNVQVADIKDEKEISDKENASVSCENTPKPKKPKRKKRTETVDEFMEDNDNAVQNEESIKEESVKQTTNISLETPSKSAIHGTFNVLSSPWSEKAKMSKRLLKSLFHRNAVENFPGSNIHEIKGYGVQRQ